MGSKTVVITRRAKLEFSLGSILIRDSEKTVSILIDDINILLIEEQGIAITGVLLSELVKRKVKVIFCDEKHNPLFECVPYYARLIHLHEFVVKSNGMFKQKIECGIE